MALKKNLEYWRISLKHPEPLIDEHYVFDRVIVEDEDLLRKVERLRELIIGYCVVVEKDEGATSKVLDEILEIVISTSEIQYTEFVAFWKVLDISYSVFKNLTDRRGILEALLREYCKRRRRLYDKLGYSDTVIQALYDSGVSRKKGVAGISKLVGLVEDTFGDVPHVRDMGTFMSSLLCYFLPDRGDRDLFVEFRREFGIRYVFGERHQGKNPDLVLKAGGHFFVAEAKHIKEGGGAQNKQVLEAIEFVRFSEDRDDIHYVSFMDGPYFNRFIRHEGRSGKVLKQRRDIERYLRENRENFFVNTAGFKALLRDLKGSFKPKPR